MKTGRFFWGAFFVSMGALLLLANLGDLQVDWGSSWRLWPLILIFWGLGKLIESRPLRAGLSSLNGIVFACLVFGFFSFQWISGEFDDTEPLRYSQHLSEPWDSSIVQAEFSFASGAGKFVVDGTSQELIDAQTESAIGRYELTRDDDDGTTSIALRMEDRRRFRFFGKLKNRAEIRLNDAPDWKIRFQAGASDLDLDLRPFKADRISIDAGLSAIRLRMGDRATEAYVRVKSGVSKVRIEVPSSVGCEINDNAHVGSTHYEGFEKQDDRTWQTEGFDSVPKKIFLDIETGVSSVRVVRY